MVAALYLGALSYPQPAFTDHVAYRQFDVWSDRPIEDAITSVLDDATRRMKTSELYTSHQRFRLFFCNSTWRLALYGLFQTKAGGLVYSWLTTNIYIRESSIAENRIVSPHIGPMADAERRPLSYVIVHEPTHVMQSRAFGRFFDRRCPTWLDEGYADYVGKGGDFDFDENVTLLRAGSPALDFARSRLCRRYHLEVAWLLDKQGMSIRPVYANPPREADLLDALTRG
jgi:hypothetical protein